MRASTIIGFMAFLCAGILLPGECADVLNTTETMNTTMVQNPNSLGHEEEDDDFVPYQGERFSIFDWTLFRAISKRSTGNILISPISIKIALVLLYEGAQDQSAHELATVLQLPPSLSATREKFTTALQSLQAYSPSYKLNIGTRLYIDSNVLVRQRYEAIAKAFYATDVTVTNMSDPHPVAESINNWVSNITDGNINKLIEDEDTIKDSAMLITNALYFKGNWRRRYFLPEDTRVNKFYTPSNESVEVPFMHTISRFYYSESPELDAKILRIPYEGHKFAMYLILPFTLNGADQLMNVINPFILTRHVWLMQDLPVDVRIPKFKFDFSTHLESSLRELGIRDIFDDTATLTGIARTKKISRHLKVNDVLQKSGIEVNENGTTAYAATEIQLGNKIEEETFHADHPFLFYIEDESTGTILYVGKVANPLEKVGAADNANDLTPSRFGEDGNQVAALSAAAQFEERFNYFNVDLLQAVREEHSNNVIISPASAKIALMTLAEGTGGRTRQELLSTLRLPEDDLMIRTVAVKTIGFLKKNESGTEIDTATRLWVRQGLTVSRIYMNVLQRFYDGDLQFVDFENTQSTINDINDWVRQATRENIHSLVDSHNVHPETRLLLTSVLYFKGRWLKSFDKNDSKLRCFNVPSSGCHNTYFMEVTSTYRYAHVPSLDADVVEIPYSDGKTSMLILLPSGKESEQTIRLLAKDLSYLPISSLIAALEETEVDLSIPRFSIESKLDLRSPLERMGIRDLFTFTANLTGIASEDSVRVSSVLQNAKIEVDEDGTIAVAATGVGIVPLMGLEVQTFHANRPFIFMIIDLQTNGTLFSGWVMDPTADLNNIK